MKFVIGVALLSALLSAPAKARDIEVDTILTCDTQGEAERVGTLLHGDAQNVVSAVREVNAEENSQTACGLVNAAYVRGKVLTTVRAKGEPPWKRYDAQRQNMLAFGIQLTGKCHDGARAAQAYIVTAVRPENAAAGIKSLDRSGVTNDLSMQIERQDSIGAAVQEQEPRVTLHGKAAWIGYASVVAELTERPAATIEGEQSAVAATIHSGSTSDEQTHAECLFKVANTSSAYSFSNSVGVDGLRTASNVPE